ncbi:SusC/RagA family TonB-linked outer membrane protein [Aquimarina hainanensis]|uniref:SusC/RagA family TonB-linked outer membrane protein n=1 Tax=Aquimarina hainanensis TaxID=1578017 RepID=A0ABW5N7X5_9FLAO
MRTKFSVILTLFLAFVVQLTFAQEKTVSGVISDNNGMPLPGVNILVKGTSSGTQSDFDGNYSIEVNKGAVLSFSYIGFSTKELVVGEESTINVTLQEDASELEEVVVTALGIKRSKKSVGYSVQSVEGEEIGKNLISDVSTAMAGKVSGVQFIGGPAAGFDSGEIRLRGNTDVLYIIDGIKMENSDNVNTEDIENMSVLKGSAATALYGPLGRNGVIIINTKRAKSGDTKVILNHGTSFETVDLLPEYQNEYGGGYSTEFDTFEFNPSIHPASWAQFDGQKTPTYKADESWGPKLDGTPVRHWDSWIQGDSEFGKLRPWSAQPDNIKDFYRRGHTSRTSLTFLKGSEDYSVKGQIMRTDRNSIVRNSDRNTTQVAFNVKYKITKKLEFYGNANYQHRKTNNQLDRNYGNVFSNLNQWWQRQLDMDRVRNYRRGGRITSWNINSPTDTQPKYWDSPFFELYENLNTNFRNSTYGNLGLNYKINDEFSANIEIRKRNTSIKDKDIRDAWGSISGIPKYDEFETNDAQDEYFAILNYNKQINKFDLLLNLGGESINNQFRSFEANTVGGLTTPDFYSIATSKDRPTIRTNYENWKNKAIFLKGSLGYNNLLFLDASYRFDWNSTANPENNRVETLGTSLSFLFSKLIPKNDILTFGKARIGYAEAPSFPDVYRLAKTYETEASYGPKGSISIPNTLPDSQLIGGVRNEIEIGTEMRFVKNRIGFDLTYFKKEDSDLPVQLSIDSSTGYNSIDANSGKQRYSGFEIGINGTPIKTDSFSWNTSINIGTLKREVIELAKGVENNIISAYSRRPNYWGNESMINIQERVGQEWGAVYGRRIKRNENGIPYINTSDDSFSFVKEEQQYLGNFLPDFTGGFSNSFKYKNLDLSIGIDFQKGGKFFSMTQMFSQYSGISKSTIGNNDKGNPIRNQVADSNGTSRTITPVSDSSSNTGGILIEGIDSETNQKASYYVSPQTYFKSKFGIGDEFIYDASYIRLRTISLSYNLPKRLSEKIGADNIKLGAYGNNLFLLYSAVPSIDPSQIERGRNDAAMNGQVFIEGGQAPSAKSYGLNVQFTF